MEASPGAVPTSVTMVAMHRKSVFVELSFFELSFFGWGCGYVRADYIYLCPAGEQLSYRYTNEEDGKTLRRYWTTACQACTVKSNAQQAKSAGSHAGSTNPSLRPCRRGSIETRIKCAYAARLS